MSRLEHVSFSYGEKEIFRDFSFDFGEQGLTLVTGPSGAGKTTLLKLLLHQEKPQKGSIFVPETYAVSFQEPRLLPWLTAEENVALVLSKDQKKEAGNWLQKVELGDDLGTYPEALSGGMQKRVSLARALAYLTLEKAHLLILDEPFSGLDPDLHVRMRELVKETTEGKAVILISHDPEDKEIADRELKL